MSNLLSLNSHAAAALLLLLVLCEWYPTRAQNPPQSELFTPVANDKLPDASLGQSSRLRQLRDLPTTQSVQVVRANKPPTLGDELKIPISKDKVLVLERTGGERHDSKNYVWVGVVHGEQRSSATLVIRNDQITGSINSAVGLYRISPLGNGLYAIVKVNTEKFSPEDPPPQDPTKQQ